MSKRDLPPIGTTLYATTRRPKRRVAGEIVADESFPLGRALLADGKRYATISGAASEIVGHRRNGAIWWRTADGRRLSEQEF